MTWSAARRLSRAFVAYASCFAMTAQTIAPAFAQGITPDRGAPAGYQPSTEAAPNGVPIVNITRPNATGLSHNKYTDFNVGVPGVILNNSSSTGRSVLGGQILGNPNLANSAAARAILNEVTSTNRSVLDGYLEVFGSSADVIVANPNGISCNGCGFINTPRATLSTGVPYINPITGAFESLSVERGVVTVGELGLDARTVDYFDIVARSVQINGAVHGKDVGVFAGRNDFDYLARSVLAKADDGSGKPVWAIDSSLLGGMYANKIALTATEKGVGVKAPPRMSATGDGISITADGRLVLGRATASKKIRAVSKAASVDVKDTVFGEAGVEISAGDSIAIDRSVVVASAVDVALTATGDIVAADNATVRAGLNLNDGSVTIGKGRIAADAGRNITINQSASLASGDAVGLSAGGTLSNAGSVQSGGDLAVAADRVDNTGELAAGGALAIDSAGQLTNSGGVRSEGYLSVIATGVDNSGTVAAAGGLSIDSAGNLSNTGGVQSGDRLSVIATGVDNSGTVVATGGLTIDSSGQLSNTGSVQSGGSLSVIATGVDNSGTVAAASGLMIDSSGQLTNAGGVQSGSDLSVNANGVDNSGTVAAVGGLTIDSASQLSNAAGASLLAAGNVRLDAATTLQNAGTVYSGGDVTADAARFDNAGSITARGGMIVASASQLSNAGNVQSGGDLSVNAGGVSNSGTVATGGGLTIDSASQLSNAAGASLLADGNVIIGAATTLQNSGTVQSGGNVTADANRFDNAGSITALGGMTIASASQLTNATGASLLAAGDLNLEAGTQFQNAGTVIAGQNVSIVAPGITATAASEVIAGSDLRLTSASGLSITGGGSFQSVGNFSIVSAGDLSLAAGLYKSFAALDVRGTSITTAGTLEAETTARIGSTSGGISNSGTVASNDGLSVISVGGLSNTGSLTSVAGVDISTGTDLSNSSTGLIASGETLSIATGGSIGNAGTIGTPGVLIVAAAGNIANTGLVFAGSDARIWLNGTLTNSGGDIISDGDLVIAGLDQYRAAGLTNSNGGLIEAARDLDIAAAQVLNHATDPVVTSSTTTTTAPTEVVTTGEYPYRAGTQTRTTVATTITTETAQVSPPAQIFAGRDLSIDADTITNRFSQIAAGGNITLTGNTLTNTALDLIETTSTNAYIVTTEIYCRKKTFGGCDWDPRDFVSNVESTSTRTHDRVFASIEAGGTITGDFSGQIDNQTIRGGAGQIGLSSQTFGAPGSVTGQIDLSSQAFGAPGSVAGQIDLSSQTISVSGTAPVTLTLDTFQGNLVANLTGRDQLFQATPDPSARFLFETRSQFIDPGVFFGSDYFLQRMGGYDPDNTIKLLGDAYFESRLVRDQLFALTGRRFTANEIDDAALMKALYDNAVDEARALNLTPGVKLTEEQIGQLRHDIIWLETITVNGQEVLAPRVYLRSGPREQQVASAAGLIGDGVALSAQNLRNSGSIAAADVLVLRVAESLENVGGSLTGASIDAIAGDTFANISGSVRGGTVQIAADTIINSTAVTRDDYANGYADRRHQTGEIVADDSLSLIATGDIVSEGGRFASGGDASLQAGGDIVLSAIAGERQREDKSKTAFDKAFSRLHEAAAIESGGDVNVNAGGSIDVIGSRIAAAGDAALVAGDGITIASVQDVDSRETTFKTKSGGLFGKKTNDSRTSQSATNQASEVVAEGNLSLDAGVDAKVSGSTLVAGQDLSVNADRNVTIEAAAAQSSSTESKSSKGFLSSSKSQTSQSSTEHQGSVLAAGRDLNVNAETGDATVRGSTLSAAEGNIGLNAGRDVNIEAVQDTSASASAKKQSGFFAEASGGSASVGYRSEKHQQATSETTNLVSGVTAGGNVEITAGRDVTSEAGTVSAGEDISISAGRDVDLKSAQDTFAHSESHKTKQIGITAEISSNVIGAGKSIEAGVEGVQNATPGTGKAISAAATALRAADAAQSLQNPSVSASVTLGVSQSKSQAQNSQSTARVGVVDAGRDLSIDADRDITATGTQISAGRDATLTAGRDLTLQSAISETEQRSSSSSASLGVGIGGTLSPLGTSGGKPSIGITVSGSAQKSQADANSTTHTNATLNAGGDVKLQSGRDTTVAGANVEGETLDVDVGRNLTVASRQNTVDAQSSSKGVSASVTFDLAGKVSGGSVGGNASEGSEDRAFTDTQTTLVGREDVDIAVEGHTQVDGAVIAAQNGELKLDTGTFGFRDLKDKDQARQRQMSANLNIGSGSPPGETSEGSPTITIDGSYYDKDVEGVSRATVSGGKGVDINIRDKDGQAELVDSGKTQDVAAINHDLDKAQEITKDDELGFSFYASDISVKKAAETAQIVGKAFSDAVGAMFDALADQGKQTFGELSDAKKQGLISDEALVEQLAQCGGGRQGFNLWNLFIGTAHAAGGCTVTLTNGRKIQLSDDDKETCLKVYLVAAWNAGGSLGEEETARGFAEGIKKEVADKGEHFAKVAKLVDTYLRGEGPGYEEAKAFVDALYAQTKDFANEFIRDPGGALEGVAREEIADVQGKFYDLIQTAQKKAPFAIGEGAAKLAISLFPANKVARIAEKVTKVDVPGGGANKGVVYRALREDEDPSKGLNARSPGADTSVGSHVMGKRDSGLISTTIHKEKALGSKDTTPLEGFNSGHGVVEIDLNKVNSPIIDASEGAGRGRVRARTKSHGEVLIRDTTDGSSPAIPPSAITIIEESKHGKK